MKNLTNLGKTTSAFGLVLLATSGLIAGKAAAADLSTGPYVSPTQVDERIDRTWEFLVAPYFVGANITGTSQVGRLPSTDIDIGTSDILENLRFGAMLRAEALYQQKFGAIVDAAYMNLGTATDTPLTGGRVRVGGSQLILETLLFYRAMNTGQTSIDVIAGSRYWDISLDVDATGTIAGSFDINRGDNWLDPVIGARLAHSFNDKWSVNLRGDIGGFGLGSDFSWNAQGGIGYNFNRTWSAHLQYKALYVDYDNNKSGTARFAYDTITHGPLIGIAARF